MTQIEQHEAFLVSLFSEVTAIKLILHALIKGTLPVDQGEAWKEIEAMVRHMEMIAKHGIVDAPNAEAAEIIKGRGLQSATEFVRLLGPRMQKN